MSERAGQSGRYRRAAVMYLDALADGDRISMRTCADRYGISVGSLHAALRILRKERRAAAPEAAP
jgi:hypothetical protein